MEWMLDTKIDLNVYYLNQFFVLLPFQLADAGTRTLRSLGNQINSNVKMI